MLRAFHSYDSLTYDLDAAFSRKNMKNMFRKIHAYLAMEDKCIKAKDNIYIFQALSMHFLFIIL
jgi:hypothetical protein